MDLHGIGASPLRKEDWPLLRGEGTFIADFKRPGMVHALVVRSPHAHARFSHIDGSAALQAPGVIDLITAAELPDRGRPIPTNDMWIAASALQHGFAVFSDDGHFHDVPGLHVGTRLDDFLM